MLYPCCSNLLVVTNTYPISPRLRGDPFLWESFKASLNMFIVHDLGSYNTHAVTELTV